MHTLSNPLSSIKNAQKAQKRVLPSFKKISERVCSACKIMVFLPRLRWDLRGILYNEGYIHGFSQEADGSLRIVLKYHFPGIGVIEGMETISKPGFRIYSSKNRLSKKREGLGIGILSTSKGNLIRDREAQETNFGGGEILRQVFQKNQVKLTEAEFFCFLEIIGVGYKASTNAQGPISYSKSGFSHEIRLQVTPPVRVSRPKPNPIRRTGMDHQKVTQFAAIVRSCKPPEVYKGRGIQYRSGLVHKKRGKKKQIMSYILGSDLNSNKQVKIASTRIFGIGPKKAIQVRDRLGPSDNIEVNKLTKYQFDQILEIISQNHLVDSESERIIRRDIKRLIGIGRYRGFRHNAGLPLRGQRTHTNAKTSRKLRYISIRS